MAEWVAVIISAIGTGAQVKQSKENKEIAKKQEKRQEQQERLRASLEKAKVRRQNRIRAAQASATAAASGVTGSLLRGAELSRESFAGAQTDIIEEQSALQLEQIGLGTEAIVSQESAAITQALGTFASDIFGPRTKTGASGKPETTTLFAETFGGE